MEVPGAKPEPNAFSDSWILLANARCAAAARAAASARALASAFLALDAWLWVDGVKEGFQASAFSGALTVSPASGLGLSFFFFLVGSVPFFETAGSGVE